jgi:uncharacterized protein YihD (DUF1040 family)
MSNLDREDMRIQIMYFLEKAWKKHPNLRLMQLIGNGFAAGDNYYVADQSVLDYLVKVVNEVED